jgi:hypothetical protein
MVNDVFNSPSTSRASAASHSARRHTRNKKSDPFLELSNDLTTASQPFPRAPKDEDNNVARGNSLLVDVRESRLCRVPT